MSQGNIFREIPEDLSEEVFEILAQNESVKIERIISKGHTSPDTGWYDQEHNEWVIVLKGSAEIAFDNGSSICLEEGDYINILGHQKHRVVSTSANPETVWLAIHYR